ncbi:FecR family protein [Dyadobacter sp. CY351]|uniref:FecR family protein n=1 Tax=Dyadobacter sp. CY351 TaxID=2909337 RepID=UPI001F421F81|nr:FecR domain-containing protein [Dyadobacter sp. CY351]MCF2517670.1 FecR domain-containing protein [Dyadobacter sp. CY351]
MNRERLQYLLERQGVGIASDEEQAELEAWYLTYESQPDFTERLSERALPALEAKMFEKIQTALEQENLHPIRSRRRILFTRMLQVAASILLVVMAGGGLYYYFSLTGLIREQTGYGQVRTVMLPDGSEVTLNGNSEITYRSNWGNEQLREINLIGEAYFKVIHTKDNRKFRVRTAEDFSLDVLGTQFTVANRKSGTRIVLDQGKVQCNLNDEENETLIMKPGEMVKFAGNPSDYVRESVETSVYSAWKEHKLIFNNTTLQEVSLILEDTYDFKIQAESPELLTRKITGSVPTDNIEILIQGIAEASGVIIAQNGKVLTITDRKR